MPRKKANEELASISRPRAYDDWTFDQLCELKRESDRFREGGLRTTAGDCRFLISKGVIAPRSIGSDHVIIVEKIYDYRRLLKGLSMVDKAKHGQVTNAEAVDSLMQPQL